MPGCTGGAGIRPPGAAVRPGGQFSFTYPPFAAALFRLGAASIGGLAGGRHHGGEHPRAGRAGLDGAGRRPGCGGARRPCSRSRRAGPADWPVDYTLHLGEVNLIVAALVGRGPAPAARRRLVAGDSHRGGGRDQADPADLRGLPAADPPHPGRRHRGRDLRRPRSSSGLVLLPAPSRVFWLGGVFWQPRAGSATRPTRPTSRWPGRWPGSPEVWTGVQGVVARGGAADRAGRDRGRRVGAPARPSAGRRGVLRRHRPARLAVLLDPPLGLGRPDADRPGHNGVAAPLARLGPGRRRGRRRFSGLVPLPGPGHPPSPVLLLAERPVRAVRPGPAGRRRPGPGARERARAAGSGRAESHWPAVAQLA